MSDWRPRLVALDVDGTVVDRAGVLPAAVAAAIGSIVAAEVPVVLCTGRSWHGTRDLVQLLGLPPGLTVCSNGAVTVRYPPEEIVSAITFDPAGVIRIVTEEAPQTLVAVEEVGVGYRLTREFPAGDLTGQMIIEDVEQLSSRPVTRVIMRDPEGSDADFLALAEKVGLHGVSYFIGYSAWLDIAPEGVNKATALAAVAAEHGVDQADVLAMGDGRNDIEMLSWAGRGVALGDAPDEVKQQADAVTADFDEGGTVAELARWFAA